MTLEEFVTLVDDAIEQSRKKEKIQKEKEQPPAPKLHCKDGVCSFKGAEKVNKNTPVFFPKV